MTNLHDQVNVSEVSVELSLPFIGKVTGKWVVDESQRKAAWEMYVELVTRISIAELGPEEGIMREALNSLYALFGITRQILRSYGPVLAQPKGKGNMSFGYLAVAILNTVLRPFLAQWHPLLMEYESKRPVAITAVEWERAWDNKGILRNELAKVRDHLLAYANLLAQVAQVSSLIIPTSSMEPPAS